MPLPMRGGHGTAPILLPVGTFLFLYTDRAVRRAVEAMRPGRTIFASDEVVPRDREVFDRVVELPPVSQVEETLAVLEGIEADEVFYQTEFGLLSGSLLARRKGLPGPTPEAAHACTNKWRTRRDLRAAGIPVPDFRLCETAADVRRFAPGFPLVLKPVASTLGRGVAKVDRDADLDEAVAKIRAFLPQAPDIGRLAAFARVARIELDCDPARQFLAESFAPGPPLEADGLVFGDQVDLFGITEQVVRDGSGFYIEAYLFPADEPGRCAEIARASVKALGLTDTGFSIEFRGDSVIEVNGRLGEDDGFGELFRAGIGQFPLAKWFQRDQRPSVVRGAHALAYVNRYAAGVVRRVGTIPPGVVVPVSSGDTLHTPGEAAYRAHVAYVIAGDAHSSRAALREARRRLVGLDLQIEDVIASSTPRHDHPDSQREPRGDRS